MDTRGSGAGSIVAWSLRITDLDPIAYDLLSINTGSRPNRVDIPGVDEFALAAKPIDVFLRVQLCGLPRAGIGRRGCAGETE